MQQVHQTVLLAGNKQRYSRKKLRVFHSPVHLEARSHWFELLTKSSPREIEVLERPLHTHKKKTFVVILVLVGMQDVGAVHVKEVGYSGHETLPVRTIDEQNS